MIIDHDVRERLDAHKCGKGPVQGKKRYTKKKGVDRP